VSDRRCGTGPRVTLGQAAPPEEALREEATGVARRSNGRPGGSGHTVVTGSGRQAGGKDTSREQAGPPRHATIREGRRATGAVCGVTLNHQTAPPSRFPREPGLGAGAQCANHYCPLRNGWLGRPGNRAAADIKVRPFRGLVLPGSTSPG
jgi:hypothetical protein